MTALLGGILLAAGVMLYVIEPLFSGRAAAAYRGRDEHDEKAARRRVALTALRDLEYDRATGKLDASDYQRLRDELSHDALRLMGQEDEASGETPARPPPTDERVERASRELEAEIAQLRRALREGLQCAACGHVNRSGARFCAACGAALVRPEAEPAVGGAAP